MLTAICPRIFPAMSSTGETAESNTSITRLDFSSTVCVSKVWPPIITPNTSSPANTNGSERLNATLVRRSSPAATVTDVARRTRITAST